MRKRRLLSRAIALTAAATVVVGAGAVGAATKTTKRKTTGTTSTKTTKAASAKAPVTKAPVTTAPASTRSTAAGAPVTTLAPALSSIIPDKVPANADRNAEFKFGINFGPSSFDPHTSRNPPADAVYMRPLYDRLVVLANSPDGAVLGPQLATAWRYSPDGLTLSMTLRDDVTFQDGTKFDANSVKANIERALSPAGTSRTLIESIQGVQVVDARNVNIRLERPDPSVLWSFATGSTGMMVSPAAFNTDLSTRPVGSGPFKLASVAPNQSVVYERWDGHWDKDAALVKKLTMVVIGDGKARYNGVRTGELDSAFLGSPEDSEAKTLTSSGYFWDQELAPVCLGLLMNTARAPFNDVRLRRAVNMAIDRTTLSKRVLNGIYPPVFQVFPRGYLGYDPAIDKDPYNMDRAKALVREAGATGTRVVFGVVASNPQELMALVMQQALKDVGLNAEIRVVPPAEGIPSWQKGDFDIYLGSILAQPEPGLTLATSYVGAGNLGRPPSELVDMATKGLSLPVGSAEREKQYQRIGAYLQENPIHVPLVNFSTVIFSRPDVVGSQNILKVVLGQIDFRRVGLAS